MKGTMKKIISVVLALAMIMTGLNYTPKVVSADTSYSTLVYSTITCENDASKSLGYSVVSNNLEGFGGAGQLFYGDKGATLQISYANIEALSPEQITVALNGNAVAAEKFAGGLKINPTTWADDSYNDIVISATNGQTLNIVFKKGNPDESGSSGDDNESSSSGETITPAVPTVSTNPLIELTNENTLLRVAGLDTITGASTYNLYVDGDLFRAVYNGETIPVSNFTTGRHLFQVTGVNSTGESEKSTGYYITIPGEEQGEFTPYLDGVKTVVIQADAGTAINLLTDTSKKKVNSTITVYDASGNSVYTSSGTAKTRGNSTLNAQKKAYNIKFDTAYELVSGAGAAKKWSLLANAFDKTMMRNKLAMDLALEMGLSNTSHSEFVNVYVNGQFLGCYLAIEPVEVGSNRVNIRSEYRDSTDMLLELEGLGNGNGKDESGEGIRYIFSKDLANTDGDNRVRFAVGSPETAEDGKDANGDSLEFTQAELDAKDATAKTMLDAVVDAIDSNNFTTISSKIDVDSFVNFYIVNELFKNKDFSYSSTRFYFDDGILYAGPLWDLDLSSGNVNGAGGSATGFYCQDMPWFEALMKNEDFKNRVEQRFTTKLNAIKSLYTGNGNELDAYVGINGTARAAINRNYSTAADGAGWSVTRLENGDQWSLQIDQENVPQTYEAHVEYLRTWLTNRVSFLTERWTDITEVDQSTLDTSVIDDWTSIGIDGTDVSADAAGQTYEMSSAVKTSYTGATPKILSRQTFTTKVSAPYIVTDGADVDDYTALANNVFTIVAPAEAGKITSVVIDGTKYRSGSENLLVQNDRVYLNQEIFTLPAGDTEHIFKITIKGEEEHTYALKVNKEEEQGYASISDWVKLSGTSVSCASIYVPKEMIDNNKFGDAGLRGYYAAGKTNRWNITQGSGIDTVPVFGFCTTGTNPSNVVIDGTPYSAGDDTVTTVVAKGNTVYINQNLVDAQPGETNYYQITATGSDTGTFWVKVVGEETPDYSSISVGDDGWTQVTTGDTSGTTKFYYQTTARTAEGIANGQILNGNILELKDLGSNVSYNGGNEKNTLKTVPVYAFSVCTGDNPESVWIDSTKLNSSKCAAFGDTVIIAQSAFDLDGAQSKIFYITIRYSSADYTYALKVVDTTVEEVPDVNDSKWVQFSGTSEYWYFIPNESDITGTNGTTDRGTDLWMVLTGNVAHPYDGVTFAGDALSNIPAEGAGFPIPYSSFVANRTVYKVVATDSKSKNLTFYVKKDAPTNYAPTGIAITQAGTMTWTPSSDATTAGATYSVTFNGNTTDNISASTTNLDLQEVTYGTYPVVLKTFVDGNEVDSQTIQFVYKDPEAVDSTLHGTGSIQMAWEKERCDYLTWDAVEGSTYAIYVDGKLWEKGITETSYNVPAYALVDNENGTLDKNDQAQTSGHHTISVVAIPTGSDAPALFADVNSKSVIGTDDFTLNLNYIYGSDVDYWNNTGVPSKWNFTITPEAGETSGLKATYNNDGTVSITNIESAAIWRAKAAIYDTPLNVEDVGGLVNISFDLTITDGDVLETIRDNANSLKIGIKCVADEVTNNGDNYYYAGKYENLSAEQQSAGLRWVYQDPNIDGDDARYAFEYDSQTNTAVLHYSLTFTPVRDTYDLLFDLEGLEGASITFSDAVAKDIYKVTQVLGSPIPNNETISNSSIQVGWNTNVPDHLAHNYYYKVYIDDVQVSDNATLDAVYAGYDAGNHTVKVESYYGLPAGEGQAETGVKTGEATATVKIVQETKPNLVVSDISITDGIHYVGNTITVTAKIKNIGNAVATPYPSNLIVWLYKKSVNDAEETSLSYQTVIDRNVEDEIGIDEERTVSWTYTLAKNENVDDTGIVSFRAVVDPEEQISELSESDNEKVARFKFYEQAKELTLTNDGTNVIATWPEITGTPDSVKLKYTTADDEEHEITIPIISTTYTFPSNVVLKNNTAVTVETVYGEDTIDYATGTALADLVATSVTVRNGVATKNANNDIIFVIKNQGTARAVTDGTTQAADLALVIGWFDEESNYHTNYKRNLSISMDPNDTYTEFVANYYPTEAGTHYLVYQIDEADHVAESNESNNTDVVAVLTGDSGSVTLDSNSGNGPVAATWDAASAVTGYKISYTSNDTVYTEEIITSGVGENAIYDSENGTYTYTFSRPLDYNSNVNILATYDVSPTELSNYYDYATAVAQPDLIITTVVSSTNDYKVKVPFSLTATVKNVGTAQVMPSPTMADDVEVDYGYWLGINMPAIAPNIAQVIGTHTINGLTVGSTVDLQINDINVLAEGTYNLVIKADDLGYPQQAENGVIDELDESNNKFTFPVTVSFVQQPMDWTPFYKSESVVSGDDVYTNGNKVEKGNVSNLPDGTKVVNMNDGSDWRPIEFKVIATNIADMNYEDIVTKWESYGGAYTALGINDNYQMIQSGNEGVTSKLEFAQVHEEDIESYDFNNDDITYTTRRGGDGLIQTFDGNGWQFHTRSFAAGKYYIAKITNDDSATPENYIVIAFRIPGDLGNWVKANARNNSDPDTLPLVFHMGNDVVDGSLYYDATDLGLAGIATYNGNHISITTDGSCTLNVPGDGQAGDPHWHMTIQYAHLDSSGNFVAGASEDDLAEIGEDPGIITLEPTAEVFGTQGKNTLLIKFPELIQQIPIHSPEGGESDSEYYLLKVYYDDVNHIGEYVNIPLRMETNVPQIDEPQNFSVWSGTDSFFVSFTETQHQLYHDYEYTFYLDGEPVTGVLKDGVALTDDTAIEGGIYELPVDAETKELLQTGGSTFTITVEAKWCQQTTSVSQDYEVEFEDGTVDIEGFQINTNKTEGGVSEFMPSFRVISHSSKTFLGEDGKLHAATETGTIYAFTGLGATATTDTMNLEYVEDDENMGYHAAQTLHGWGGLETTTNYFSLTVKEMKYSYDKFKLQYSFRAYVKLDNGEVRYGDHIYTVSTYDIAKNLYDNQKMSTLEAHNFLYDQILNVVAMNENASQIGNAMNKALTSQYGTIDSATYQNYIQTFYKDLVYAAKGIYGYDYDNRQHHDFTSFGLAKLRETAQADLLAALNNAQDADYTTIYDWIYNETGNYKNKSNVSYQGFYKEVDYGWGKAYSTDFDTEE